MLRLAVSLGAVLTLLAATWPAGVEGALEGSEAAEADGELQPKPGRLPASLRLGRPAPSC